MSAGERLRSLQDRLRPRDLLIGGAVLVLLSLVPALFDRGRFLPSYLVAYLFWTGIALGCVALLMLHHLVGGSWGLVIRRPMEAGAMTLLPLLVLFVPLALGLIPGAHALYPWVRPEFIAGASEGMQYKIEHWLNPGFFLLRTAFYFLVWIGLAYLLNRWSAEEDRATDFAPTRRLQALSGPGLGLLFLSASFAAIDWMMSLEPDWYSTIYGPMVIVGWGLLTFAAMTIIAIRLAETDAALAGVVTPANLHDLGNLMLAFTMLWAYLSFSQFLIIWSGNLAEEIPWYLRRTRGGWQVVVLALMLFHFFLPFFYLLFRENKRKARTLQVVAGLLIAMQLVNLTWLVLPARFLDPLGPVWFPWFEAVLTVVATVGLGGIWLAAFLWRLRTRPLVPGHPDLAPASEHAWEA